MPNFIDHTGQRFGDLTVVSLYSRCSRKENRQTRWLCKCDCGKEVVVQNGNLVTGNTKSCGCLRFKSQGAYVPNKNRVYNSWHAMKARCYSPCNNRYRLYGGRGIRVCDEWKNSFEAFREWALSNGYAENLTIDRIDPDGDYCPDNCRWIPPEMQSSTRRCVKRE